MMDFVDSLRRGVDRAGFEVDRLLRANRVRSRINALRAMADEEERQIGRRVVELHSQGETVHPGLAERCQRVEQYRKEVVQREAELEAINQETMATSQPGGSPAYRPTPAACLNCGAVLPEDASFCPKCGVAVRPALQQTQKGVEEVGR